MANYNLSDILRRELWTTEDINEAPELLALYNSGILVSDPRIQKMIDSSDGGTRIEIPFIQLADYSEPNISDDSTTLATPEKIGKVKQMALLGNYNKVYGAFDIARELDSGKDPYMVVRDYIGTYWAYDIKHRMASYAVGILANNIADDGADLYNDQSGTQFDYNMVIDTHVLKGDRGIGGSDFMFMHSKALASIKKSDAGRVRAVLDSTSGKLLYSLYDESSIIITDDIMPFDGTNTTVMFADSGSFVYGDSANVINPLMMERNELIGDGGGQEVVISRKRYLISANGYSYTGAVQAKSTGATIAELQDSTNHDRVISHKQSPLSWLTFAV